jgi:hypothetical protein
MVNRTVAFVDAICGESGPLELAIHIAGEHEGAATQTGGNVAQDLEPAMRHGAPVKRQAVAVEAPGQFRRLVKGIGTGNPGKGDVRRSQGRVGLPESLPAAEVGQAGIDPHACTGRDQQTVGLADPVGNFLKSRGHRSHSVLESIAGRRDR